MVGYGRFFLVLWVPLIWEAYCLHLHKRECLYLMTRGDIVQYFVLTLRNVKKILRRYL